MDQNTLPLQGIGHNSPPEAVDPTTALTTRLGADNADLVARFHDLELGCARVPDPITTEEDASLATDFIAQCQLQIRQAETRHKREKEPFLKACRIIDGFFKRRCEALNTALAPVLARLKAYRDAVAEQERRRHAEIRRQAEEEARRAAAEAAERRAIAEQLAGEAETETDRIRAAEELQLAEEAALRAVEAGAQASLALEPRRIHGDYGSTAYVRRSWSFEVVDLDQVPRQYMSLDVAVVRQAITRDKVRRIPGLRIFRAEALHVRGAA
jgi:hypothetical protein